MQRVYKGYSKSSYTCGLFKALCFDLFINEYKQSNLQQILHNYVNIFPVFKIFLACTLWFSLELALWFLFYIVKSCKTCPFVLFSVLERGKCHMEPYLVNTEVEIFHYCATFGKNLLNKQQCVYYCDSFHKISLRKSNHFLQI